MALITFLRTVNFVFVDESGLNRYYRREMARAKRGAAVYERDHSVGQRRLQNIYGFDPVFL